MTSNQLSFIFCIVLAAILALVLFVESKRPIYVDITIDEINKEMCRYYGNEKNKNKKEAKQQGQSSQSTQAQVKKDDNQKEKKGDLNGG
jgi:hypothetical protein